MSEIRKLAVEYAKGREHHFADVHFEDGFQACLERLPSEKEMIEGLKTFEFKSQKKLAKEIARFIRAKLEGEGK
jgi:hypothetical protein